MVKEDLSREEQDRYIVDILVSPGIKSRDSLLKGEEFPPAKSPHEPFKKKSFVDSSAIRARLKRKSSDSVSARAKDGKRKIFLDDVVKLNEAVKDLNISGISPIRCPVKNYSDNVLCSASEGNLQNREGEERERRASSDGEVHDEEDPNVLMTVGRRKSSLDNLCDRRMAGI